MNQKQHVVKLEETGTKLIISEDVLNWLEQFNVEYSGNVKTFMPRESKLIYVGEYKEAVTPEKFARRCECCGKGMNTGYVIDDASTYCGDNCLNMTFTVIQKDGFAIGDDDSDSYYTEWDEIDTEQFFDRAGVEFNTEKEFELYNQLNNVISSSESSLQSMSEMGLGMEKDDHVIDLKNSINVAEVYLMKFEEIEGHETKN